MKKLWACMLAMLLLVCGSVNVFAADKSIYFNQVDGKLVYDSTDPANADRFMQVEDMQAHQTYTDTLQIENKTAQEYELFLQITPKEGSSELSLDLLKAIQMKVYDGTELLFEGTADALVQEAGSPDLKKMTSIGVFAPGAKKDLHVEVALDMDDTVPQMRSYYVKTEYDAWEAANFIGTITTYESQDAATQAAAELGQDGITYVEKLDWDKASELFGASAETVWSFYATREDAVAPEEPTKSENPETPQPNTPTIEPIVKNPQTADFFQWAILAAVGLSFAAIAVVVTKKRRAKYLAELGAHTDTTK